MSVHEEFHSMRNSPHASILYIDIHRSKQYLQYRKPKNPERPAHQIKSTKQIPRHDPIAESLFTRNSNSDVSQGWYAHTPDNSTRQLPPKNLALDKAGSPR